MPVTELTINRPNWLHNEGGLESKLLREIDNKMCCLGFYSLACGLSKADIKGIATASETVDEIKDLPEDMRWLTNNHLYEDSKDATRLMRLNDGPTWPGDGDPKPDSKIEAGIVSIFAKHGVTVTFTDEPLA